MPLEITFGLNFTDSLNKDFLMTKLSVDSIFIVQPVNDSHGT